LAIANNPDGTSYNPFMVYGGVGLGKTHLAQAIGNSIHSDEPGRAVVYVSSEQFTSQFVRAIQRNSITAFTAFYRQIDVLIVDDVQFFSGKEKTQEEFFHVFNTLHQEGKQIVLCADRPPRAIDGIEERLLSRFQWGLSADVQQPDLETRLAILQSKAELLKLDLPAPVIEYIAHNVQDSIRNLEGTLLRLKAHTGITGDALSLKGAKRILNDVVTERDRYVDVSDIMDVVAAYYRLDENALPGRSRKQQVVKARQMAIYFARELTEKSLSSIGDHFGGRDHSTVIHSINAIRDRLDTDDRFQREYDEVRQTLRSRGAIA
jgi:chromosomal replication initiator protein